jgi:hypothetical protein
VYDDESIARSVRRYIAPALGQPWNLMLERQEVRDDARPAGVVELGAAKERRARTSLPQGEVENFIAATVTLYPATDAPRKAGREARQLAGFLRRLIQFGADPEGADELTRADGRPMAGPARLPLWDYDGAEPGTAGPPRPHDTMWAEDWSADAIQDPLDARRWSVVLEMRLSWEEPGRLGEQGPNVADVVAVPPDPADQRTGFVYGDGEVFTAP